MGAIYSDGVFAGYSQPTAGALPWNGGGSGAGAFSATTPGGVAAAYQGAYNNALAMNQSNYNNILSGYQNLLSRNSTAQQAIQAGYSNLYNNVIGQVQGIGQAQAQQIDRQYQADLATGSQQLVDRGLGNTTIQESVNRGAAADRNLAQLQLQDTVASRTAGYMSSLGLAGLQQQQQGVNTSNDLALSQLGFQNSVQANYPNGGVYGNLAQNLAQQAALAKFRGGAYGAGSFAGAGRAPQVGYVPGQNYMGGAGSGVYEGSSGTGSGWAANPGAEASWNPAPDAYSGGGDYGSNAGYNVSGIGSSIASGVQDAQYAYSGGGDYGG
jgi:hypothetical protein